MRKEVHKARKAVERANKLPQRKSKRKQTNCPSALKKRKDVVQHSEAESLVHVDGIDSNECCVCHGTYAEDVEHGNGSQWILCQCGQWLHEDCVSDLDLGVDDCLGPMCTEK